MRIISKFHDYYDSAMGHGQDPNIVYMRSPSITKVDGWKWDHRFVELLNYGHLGWHLRSNLGAIGFCGRCYPVWLDLSLPFEEEALTKSTSSDYSLDCQTLLSQVTTKYFEESGSFRPSRRKHLASEKQIAELVRKSYDATKKMHGIKVDDAVFRELDAPVFIAVGWNQWLIRDPKSFKGVVMTNPRLATLGFQSTLDAFSAFQEIAIFLGSVLAKEPIAPDTVGDDELIAKSKGFDEQSFRTAAPGQKKLNRKLNKEAKRNRK